MKGQMHVMGIVIIFMLFVFASVLMPGFKTLVDGHIIGTLGLSGVFALPFQLIGAAFVLMILGVIIKYVNGQ